MNIITLSSKRSIHFVFFFITFLLVIRNTILTDLRVNIKIVNRENHNQDEIEVNNPNTFEKNATDKTSKRKIYYNSILDELDILSGGPASKYLNCTPPLVNFANIIRYRREDEDPKQSSNGNNYHHNEGGIPKIMHFSYKSRCLPQDLARTLYRWHAVLPSYSFFFMMMMLWLD